MTTHPLLQLHRFRQSQTPSGLWPRRRGASPPSRSHPAAKAASHPPRGYAPRRCAAHPREKGNKVGLRPRSIHQANAPKQPQPYIKARWKTLEVGQGVKDAAPREASGRHHRCRKHGSGQRRGWIWIGSRSGVRAEHPARAHRKAQDRPSHESHRWRPAKRSCGFSVALFRAPQASASSAGDLAGVVPDRPPVPRLAGRAGGRLP